MCNLDGKFGTLLLLLHLLFHLFGRQYTATATPLFRILGVSEQRLVDQKCRLVGRYHVLQGLRRRRIRRASVSWGLLKS